MAKSDELWHDAASLPVRQTGGNAADADAGALSVLAGSAAEGLRAELLTHLTAGEWKKLTQAAKFEPGTLALLCRVSLRSLERLFLRRFGQTPTEWMRDLRCRRAAALIVKGAYTKEAAAELGFANSSHFCHEFKKAFGVSPKRFVRDHSWVRGGGASDASAVVTLLSNLLRLPSSDSRGETGSAWCRNWILFRQPFRVPALHTRAAARVRCVQHGS